MSQRVEPTAKVPEDLTSIIPYHYTRWLEDKGIFLTEITENWKYSPSTTRIVHEVEGRNGKFAELRTMFSNEVHKAIHVGRKPYHIYGNLDDSGVLVVVEDLISAIKVGRLYGTLCLFGDSLPNEVIAELGNNPNIYQVIVWLDGDKYNLSKEYANAFRKLNLDSAAVFTKEDPKAYSQGEIKDLVEEILELYESIATTPRLSGVEGPSLGGESPSPKEGDTNVVEERK